MRELTPAERRLEAMAAKMGTDNENLNAIVEKARALLDPDSENFFGAQKSPSSVSKIKAEIRYVIKELAAVEATETRSDE